MKDPIMKKRKISIEDVDQISDINRVEESLKKMTGMIYLDVDVQKNVLKLKYDLRRIKFEEIEKTIKRLGLRLSQKIFQRLKRGMAKFTEQNELDNLTSKPASCCSDPKEKSVDYERTR